MIDYSTLDDDLSTVQIAPGERPTPCTFVTGEAGTGKTFAQMKAVEADPAYGALSATTGIASVNLGAVTVQSLLKYSTTDVLRDHYISGALNRTMHSLAKRVRRLIVDEVSMADADQLDMWFRTAEEVNRFEDVPEAFGITLVGDFAQLPPIESRWAFEANCWDNFRANTIKLTEQHRQNPSDPFYRALNLVRKGMGVEGADLLAGAGAGFESMLDTEFDGTTILPKNKKVKRFNILGLDRVRGEKFTVDSRRWGKQHKAWEYNHKEEEWGIPLSVDLKVGAYVMILANASDFSYVNGDCGWITDFYESRVPNDHSYITIRLVRTNQVICLAPLVRGVEHSEKPADFPADAPRVKSSEDHGDWLPRPHYRTRVRRWVTGQIEYFPLRLAYATTVHKSQGLTLGRVQVDYRDGFFKTPGMLYVALSRCRTLEGLRLVGQREVFARHCQFDQRIKEWL